MPKKQCQNCGRILPQKDIATNSNSKFTCCLECLFEDPDIYEAIFNVENGEDPNYILKLNNIAIAAM